MLKIKNPEGEKVLRKEAHHFKSLIEQAKEFAPNRKALFEMLESSTDYIEQMIPAQAKELNLGFLKLVDLYELPLKKVSHLSSQLANSKYLEFLEEDLTINESKIEAHIEDEAAIRLRGEKETIYKEAEAIAKKFNSLKSKLNANGKNPTLNNIIRSDYAGNWAVNQPHILTLQL